MTSDEVGGEDSVLFKDQSTKSSVMLHEFIDNPKWTCIFVLFFFISLCLYLTFFVRKVRRESGYGNTGKVL